MQDNWEFIVTTVIAIAVAVVGWGLFMWKVRVNRRLQERQYTTTALENYTNSLYKQLDRNPNPQEKRKLEKKLELVLELADVFYNKELRLDELAPIGRSLASSVTNINHNDSSKSEKGTEG